MFGCICVHCVDSPKSLNERSLNIILTYRHINAQIQPHNGAPPHGFLWEDIYKINNCDC